MNVLNHLKDKSVEEIQNYCVSNAYPAAVAMSHINGDFNLSTVLRNANYFGFQKVYYIGGKRGWDRRGAVGTHHYTPIEHCKTEDEFFDKIKGVYIPIAIECNVNYPMIDLNYFTWPLNPVVIFGEEQAGLSDTILSRCETVVTIVPHGSVRSLNVGTSSGIVLHNYSNNGHVHRLLKHYEKNK